MGHGDEAWDWLGLWGLGLLSLSDRKVDKERQWAPQWQTEPQVYSRCFDFSAWVGPIPQTLYSDLGCWRLNSLPSPALEST